MIFPISTSEAEFKSISADGCKTITYRTRIDYADKCISHNSLKTLVRRLASDLEIKVLRMDRRMKSKAGDLIEKIRTHDTADMLS